MTGVRQPKTEEEESLEALHESQEIFRAFVEGVSDHAVCTLDTNGRIRSWNSGAQRIQGYQADEILGQHFSRFYNEEDCRDGEPARGLSMAAKLGKFETEGWRLRKDGSCFWAGIVIDALRDPTGNLIGFATITRDLSERSEEEERRHLLIEAAPNGMLLVDETDTISFANSQAEALFGYMPGELAGKRAEYLIPEHLRTGLPALLAMLRTSRQPRIKGTNRTLYGLHRKGAVFPIEVRLNSMVAKDGIFVVASVVDITERRRREAALQRSEAQYRLLADNATDMIVRHDFSDRRSYVSPSSRRILGYEPEEFARIPGEQITHPEDWDELREAYDALRNGQRESAATFRLKRKDGRYIWVDAAIRLVEDDMSDGGIILTRLHDVTARKQAENALRASEERFRLSFETASHGMALVSTKGKWLQVNAAICRMVGYSESELLATDFQSITHPDDLDSDLAQLRATLAGEIDSYQMEKRYLHKSGRIIWGLLDVSLVRGPDGRPLHFVSQIQEITERKLAQDALRDSETRYRTLADNTTDLITLQSTDRRGQYVSPASRRLLGYEPEEMLGLTAETLIHPDDLESYFRHHNALSADRPSSKYVHRLRRKDGSHIWVEAVYHWVAEGFGGNPQILTIVRDISERKAAEDEANRLQTLLNDAVSTIEDGIAIYDSGERLIVANAGVRRLAGDYADQLQPGNTFEQLIGRVRNGHGRDLDEGRFAEFLTKRLAQFRRADGTPSEHRLPDGTWLSVRDFRTREGGVVSVTSDITALKNAALEIDQARAKAEAANEAKTMFLASMSHEIRTPMNGVMGFADLLLDSELSDEQRRQVTGLKDAGKSLLAIINDILDISKIEAGKLELERIPMNPEGIVDGTAALLGAQIAAKGLQLRIDHGTDVPDWIEGDPTRVRQILLNLLSNALKFTDVGHITLRYRRDDRAGQPMLRFEVQDTGIGIPTERQHLLFQSFSQIDRSTTRRYGGTGLGLSICKRLAEAMGGTTGVESELGLGSNFWFTMALIETRAPTAVPEARQAIGVGPSSVRVLVAEDLDVNQLIIDSLLRRAGHLVTMVANGAEALEAVQANDYDLVLMDMEMPEMDGIEATRAIRELGERVRHIPIVALTANAMLEDAEKCRAAGMNDFLPKPIDRADLLAMVAKWSGGAHAAESGADGRAAVLDEGVLAELEQMIGRDQTAAFGKMFRDRIEELVAISDAKDADRTHLAHAAHNLTSIAGNFGCVELMGLARDLSSAIKRDRPGVERLMSEIVQAADRALTALDHRYPS